MSVVVVSYDSAWPQHFQQIKAELEPHLQDVPYISIEHVGSTAVPGLAAKPIIDVDIIVKRENVGQAIDALVTKGKLFYLGELGIVDRHVFRVPSQSPRRNIYVCVDGVAQTRNHLGLRDTLRTNPELRDEYARVKLELASKGTNLTDYIEAKSTIVQKILRVSGMLTTEELEDLRKANLKGDRWGALKIDRLLLREFQVEDIDAYHALESTEANARYQSWGPRTMEESRELVWSNMQNSTVNPRTNWELVVESEERLVGRVGAALTRLDAADHAQPDVRFDLWFSFLPAVHGKGFATEAVRALVDVLTEKYNEKGVEFEIECDPRNTGSCKLAERLGFEKHSLTEKAWESKGECVDSLVYRKMVHKR
ncbi:acyl-CoA N-acyltransferase [Ophiobolus disseminans]|uniref:Acyl-CoA N-acyltransferase n=1 Tax=Ophiobolus disseminans TaxID=1469910 RepID=A0A6A7AIF2_9PLEO|nr:acyl-CoA N-acyltransferase [Ophiobolus disseminans]